MTANAFGSITEVITDLKVGDIYSIFTRTTFPSKKKENLCLMCCFYHHTQERTQGKMKKRKNRIALKGNKERTGLAKGLGGGSQKGTE